MKRKNNNGQAYVELIFIIPVLTMFLVALVFFARVFTAKIILEQACRHGVFIIAYQKSGAIDIKSEILNYLKTEKFLFENIKYENIEIAVNYGLQFKPSSVSIRYPLKIPGLLAGIKGFPKEFAVTGYSECFTGAHVF